MKLGIITITIVKQPAIIEFPVEPVFVKPSVSIKNSNPNIPNRIDGVEPKLSIKNKIIFLNFPSLAYSLKKIAMNKQIGKEIISVTRIIINVFKKDWPIWFCPYINIEEVGNVDAPTPLTKISPKIQNKSEAKRA